MNDHHIPATEPYDWTSDREFLRVLDDAGEHHPDRDTLPVMAPAAVLPAYVERDMPDLAAFTRIAELPVIYDTPRPGTMQVRTADGRTLYVYLDADSDPTNAPAPRTTEQATPYVSRWAVNTALVSLAVSGSAWISALALGEFAHAAAALAAALLSLGKLALMLAIVLGLFTLVRKQSTPAPTTLNAHVTATGLFGTARMGKATLNALRRTVG